MIQDVRFALRSLRRTPVFALTAAAILALGIGANATVFSIVNTVMLRPLPFDRADDIVHVRRRVPSGSSVSFPMHDYLALRAQQGAVSALAILDVFNAGRYNMAAAGGAEPITGLRVSAQFFAVFGVAPIAIVLSTMTAVVITATYLPASRAATIDPMLALRHE
jgi:ABC-type antimicrobial peptide transport system permease subunit